MVVFPKKIYRGLELLISLAAALRAVSFGTIRYVVERYSQSCFLARVSFEGRTSGLNGTSLAKSPWSALVKAQSELIERSVSAPIESKMPKNIVCGVSASVFSNLAVRRAKLELFERDALVNFWTSGKYLQEMTPDHDWTMAIRNAGLSFDLRLYLVPSHKYFVTVALLIKRGISGDMRLHAVGCRADSCEKAAALAAVQEATMLALNAPEHSVPLPNFTSLEKIKMTNFSEPSYFDFDLRSVSKKVGIFKVHILFSANLSGLRNGSPIISWGSYERLHACTPNRTQLNIPYFTTGFEAASYG